MAGLDPAIHRASQGSSEEKSWMRGSKPGHDEFVV